MIKTLDRVQANRPKRRLPFAPSHTFVFPGLGALVLESVGNCNHTTGVFVYFHEEGAEEAEMGCSPYTLMLDDECRLSWQRSTHTGSGLWAASGDRKARYDAWTARVHDTVLELLNGMPQRSPGSFMFQAMGRLERDLASLKGHRDMRQRGAESLESLLADPSEPRRAEISDPEKRAAMRTAWETRLEGHRAYVAQFDAENGAKVATLQRMIAACRTWSKRDTDADIVAALEAARLGN